MNNTGYAVQQHISYKERLIHIILTGCTLGIWYPVWKAREKNALRKTTFYVRGN